MDNSTPEIKRGRGRPRKIAIAPLINETQTKLQMEQKANNKMNIPPYTLESLTSDYIRLYGKACEASEMGKNKKFDNIFNGMNSINPFIQNARVKSISSQPYSYTKEDIIKALQTPQYSEEILRQSSWSLSSNQYLYYLMLRESCDIPCFKYYKIPELLSKEEYSSKDFKAQDKFLDDWLQQFDIVNCFKRISLEVKREGKSCYMLRNSICDNGISTAVNYATFQKMPSNYVKITGIGERGYTFSFNMLLFAKPGFYPGQYSDYIRQVWAKMNEEGVVYKKDNIFNFDSSKAMDFSYSYNNKQMSTIIENKQSDLKKKLIKDAETYMFWVEIPQEIGYVFASDTSNAWVCPDTAGLFLNLQELTDYSTLAGLIASTQLTAVLTAEAEFVENASAGKDMTKINPEILKGLQDTFNLMTSTNVEAFFAPLKNFKLLTVPNQVNSSEIKTKALQDFIVSSGEGGVIVATDKPSIAQIKGVQAITASKYDFVTKQLETTLNYVIRNLIGLKYEWKIKIFGNVFELESEKKFLKELVMGGAKFFLPKLLACEDINSLRDTEAIVNYIESCGFYKELETLTMFKQAEYKIKDVVNNSTEQDSVGRPMDEDSQNENTLASRDGGNNLTENKSVYNSIKPFTCAICGKEIEQESGLCEECIETYEINNNDNN